MKCANCGGFIENGHNKCIKCGKINVYCSKCKSIVTEDDEFCSVDDNNKEPFVVLSYEQSLIFEASHNVMYPVTNFSSREEYYKFFREFKKYYNLGKEACEKQIIKK